QIRPALEHLRRRRPIRPFTLARDLTDAGPGEAGPANPDAIADRSSVVLDQIEQALIGVDDDGATAFPTVIVDDLLLVARIERVLPTGRILLNRLHLALERQSRLIARRCIAVAGATEQQFKKAAAEIRARRLDTVD